jgi:hypothetical protein
MKPPQTYALEADAGGCAAALATGRGVAEYPDLMPYAGGLYCNGLPMRAGCGAGGVQSEGWRNLGIPAATRR